MMSKELEALRDLKEIGQAYNKKEFERRLEIIENALMKRTIFIIADNKISDDDLEKLKNQRMFPTKLEQCEIKPLFDEDTEKKLKALEILKQYLYIDDENTLRLKNGTNLDLVGIIFCDKKVANLLKEVLL